MVLGAYVQLLGTTYLGMYHARMHEYPIKNDLEKLNSTLRDPNLRFYVGFILLNCNLDAETENCVMIHPIAYQLMRLSSTRHGTNLDTGTSSPLVRVNSGNMRHIPE